MTPTQRTLAYLRDQGMLCAIVERFIPNPKHPGGGFRSDFLGFLDIIAIGPDGIVGVQSCGADFAAHRRKILEERRVELDAWLEAGGRVMLIGWTKRKIKRGGKAMRWTPRIEEIKNEQ